jgi:hypothetical protein
MTIRRASRVRISDFTGFDVAAIPFVASPVAHTLARLRPH